MFWIKKKKDESVIYGTLNQRLFAALIDLFILIVIWTPIEKILMALIYRNSTPPRQEFSGSLEQQLEQYKNSTEQIDPSFILNNFNHIVEKHGLWSVLLEQILTIIVLITFTLLFWFKKQATPGKMLLKLKIVDNNTLQPPTTMQYIIRLFSYLVSMLPLGLGVFSISMSKKKRGWHDLIAGTAVIKITKKKNAEQL